MSNGPPLIDAGFEPVPMPDAEVYYLPHLPLGRAADEVMRRLTEEVPWRAEEIVMTASACTATTSPSWGRNRSSPR
jgi:hypothetical protein